MNYTTTKELVKAFVKICDCELSVADVQWLNRNIENLLMNKIKLLEEKIKELEKR